MPAQQRVEAAARHAEQLGGLRLVVILSSAGLAGIGYPLIATELVTRIGWRETCALMGLVAAAIGVPVTSLFVRERTMLRGGSSLAGVVVRDALRTPVFWILIAVVFGSTLALNGIAVHLLAMLTDRGLTAGTAAGVAACVGASSIAGRMITGWLLDRLNALAVGAALLATAAAGVALLIGADTGIVAATAAALIGFGTGGEFDVVPYVLSRRFGLRSLSTLYGCSGPRGPGRRAGSSADGRAFDTIGTYDSVLVVLAATTLAGAALLLAAPLTEQKRAATAM